MEIDEFIEQDVLIFLDDKMDELRASPPMSKVPPAPTVYLTRDYEKELKVALEKEDLSAAKKVIFTLKREFDECPAGTIDKQKLKALLYALYQQFKGKVEEERGGNQSKEVIQIRSLLAKTFDELEAGRVKEAVSAYRDAKIQAERTDDVPQELMEEFLAAHKRIRDALEKGSTDATTTQDKQILLNLEQEKHKLDEFVHNGRLPDAINAASRMKILAQQLQDPNVQQTAMNKIRSIESLIDKLRQHAMQNDQRLTAVP